MEKRAWWRWGQAAGRQEEPVRDPEEGREDGREEVRNTAAPAGPPLPGHAVTDYAVPDYQVPEYTVPDYSGPDLTPPPGQGTGRGPDTGHGPGAGRDREPRREYEQGREPRQGQDPRYEQGREPRQEYEQGQDPRYGPGREPRQGYGQGREPRRGRDPRRGQGREPSYPPGRQGGPRPDARRPDGPPPHDAGYGPSRPGSAPAWAHRPPQDSPRPDTARPYEGGAAAGGPYAPASAPRHTPPRADRPPALPQRYAPRRQEYAPQDPGAPRAPEPRREAGGPQAPGAPRPGHAAPSGPGATRPEGPSAAGVPGEGGETGPWRRIVVGTPAAWLEPKPPPADPYRPDTLFDGWSTPHLTVRLASVRGDAHRSGRQPRQDDVTVAWHEPSGAIAFAVADGVSSAPRSHVGAALACRTAVNDLLAQLDEDRPEPDWSRVLQAAAYQLLMRVARGREPGEGDQAEAIRTLATTLVTGTVAPTGDGGMRVTLVRAGDSSAWCLRQGEFAPLLCDEEAGPDEISSTAVVALPRLSARSRPMTCTLPPDGVLLVGTDGFGVPLGDGTGLVGELFARGLTVPPRRPQALAHLLDFSRETFDDDRTLLAVWPRHRLPGDNRWPAPTGGGW